LISNVIVPPQRSSIAARTRSSGSEFCAVKLQAKAPAASSGHERAHIHPQGHQKKNYDTTRSSEPTRSLRLGCFWTVASFIGFNSICLFRSDPRSHYRFTWDSAIKPLLLKRFRLPP